MNESNLPTVTTEELEQSAMEYDAEKRLRESSVRLTWDLLVLLEPELEFLLKDVRAVRDDPESGSFCANWHWYCGMKPRLLKLVGWERPSFHPILSTPQAYDIAYDNLYDILPPCRECACL